MTCVCCEERIPDGEVRWAYDEPHCEHCFDENYNYCTSCDTIISNDDTNYNSNGDSYCNACWEENIDDDAPDNPDVYDEDRELVIKLSRDWLQNKVDYRKPISINEKDQYLNSIRAKVGFVEHPIYLFGLLDREEFQISCSHNLFDDVKEFALLNLSNVIVAESFGTNRLGISLSLRENNLDKIVDLIRFLTKIRQTVPAQ